MLGDFAVGTLVAGLAFAYVAVVRRALAVDAERLDNLLRAGQVDL